MKARFTVKTDTVVVPRTAIVTTPNKIIIELTEQEATMLKEFVGGSETRTWIEKSTTFAEYCRHPAINGFNSFDFELYRELNKQLSNFS